MARKAITVDSTTATVQVDKKALNRQKLNELITSFNKKNQKTNPDARPPIFWASSQEDFITPHYLSTNNPALDRALGGGFRKGVPIEVFGGEGTGKTTTAMMAIKSCLNEGGIPAFISTEQPIFPTDQAAVAGLTPEDIDNILYLPPMGSAEDIFNRLREIMWDSAKSEPRYLLDLIVIDSIAGLLPQDELKSIDDKGFEGHTMGRHAAMVSKFYRYMCSLMSPLGVLLSINQMRSQIGQTPLPDITPGGKAVRYYNKTRIQLKPDKETAKTMVDDKKAQLGNAVEFIVVKNNVGRPYVTGSYRYWYGIGLDVVTPVVEEALDNGVIWKDSPTSNLHKFLLPDGTESKVNGWANTIKYFQDNKDSFETLRTAVESVRNAEVVDESLEPLTIQDILNEDIFDEVEEVSSELLEAQEVLDSQSEKQPESEVDFTFVENE